VFEHAATEHFLTHVAREAMRQDIGFRDYHQGRDDGDHRARLVPQLPTTCATTDQPV
jgi:hypothetical protein